LDNDLETCALLHKFISKLKMTINLFIVCFQVLSKNSDKNYIDIDLVCASSRSWWICLV